MGARDSISVISLEIKEIAIESTGPNIKRLYDQPVGSQSERSYSIKKLHTPLHRISFQIQCAAYYCIHPITITGELRYLSAQTNRTEQRRIFLIPERDSPQNLQQFTKNTFYPQLKQYYEKLGDPKHPIVNQMIIEGIIKRAYHAAEQFCYKHFVDNIRGQYLTEPHASIPNEQPKELLTDFTIKNPTNNRKKQQEREQEKRERKNNKLPSSYRYKDPLKYIAVTLGP